MNGSCSYGKSWLPRISATVRSPEQAKETRETRSDLPLNGTPTRSEQFQRQTRPSGGQQYQLQISSQPCNMGTTTKSFTHYETLIGVDQESNPLRLPPSPVLWDPNKQKQIKDQTLQQRVQRRRSNQGLAPYCHKRKENPTTKIKLPYLSDQILSGGSDQCQIQQSIQPLNLN